MKYLRCDNCGHPNPLKSEYLTFCDICSKKLQPTFADWRAQHPLTSFSEYVRMVGITIESKEPNAIGTWLKRVFQPANKGKLILFFSVFFVLLAVTGSLFGKKAVISFFYSKVPSSYLYSSWHTATIGRQALEISSPVKLWIHDQPLETEMAKTIEYAKSYSNEEEGGLRITVNMHSYQPNVSNTLEDAMAASHLSLQMKETATDITCKSVPVLISGVPGVLEEGNYMYKGALRLSFSNLIMIKGSNRWQILINYRDDDQIGQQVAQRILKSVKIK
ncbi:hypothetical protein DVR12_16460 [Chitinophaga silvatica]|uniref:Uncharacterized protein n=1 Tax=Chitinophaga silvatica TaxID=2282649 RepID=A0A3E1Y7A5_9BACT|nr:hypothetical protein [Chitinophaga silvatica]RFS20945.1 hypothetical protein DVR12_16460 [Chitinophaga silvatica]